MKMFILTMNKMLIHTPKIMGKVATASIRIC